MGKIKLKIVIIYCLLLLTGICFMSCVDSNSNSVRSFSTSNNAANTKKTTAVYYDFDDVLIPTELTIVQEKTKFYRSSEKLIGFMTLKGRVERRSLYNFFEFNMQKDQWKTVSAIRTPDSTYAVFFKKNRISVIGIIDDQFYTYVKIAVMPQQKNLTLPEALPEIVSNKKVSGKKSRKTTAVYYDFEDVLFPMELKIVKDKTVIVNTPGYTSGLITLKGRVEDQSLSRFFHNNMQKDNWIPLCSLSMTDRIVQVFIKGGRCALIEIENFSSTTYAIVGVAPNISNINEDMVVEKNTFADMKIHEAKSSDKKIDQKKLEKTEIVQSKPKPKPNVSPDVTAPLITVLSPVSKNSKLKVNQKKITLEGQATDSSGVYEVKVNGVEAQLGDNGLFAADVRLAVGENKIVITAVDIKNNISDKTIYIHRKPSLKNLQKIEAIAVDKEALLDKKDFFALLIACEQYQQERVDDLKKPVADAKALKNILCSSYSFPKKNVTLLTDPDRNKILSALEDLSNRLHKNSRLLIFYAGHAIWDKKLKQGYWLPVDAKVNTKGAWIPNSTIRDYIRGIPSKHTLLISDACFSGGIFKTRKVITNNGMAYSKLDALNSKKAITSGTMNEVPDDSIFMKYLLMRLEDNKKVMMTSEELFFSLRTAVINNSPIHQVPQFGVIRETGDEGGEFIFIRK